MAPCPIVLPLGRPYVDHGPRPKPLPPPARFFAYTPDAVRPGHRSRPLGSDYGHGLLDAKVFFFDADWPRIREHKARCQGHRLRHVIDAGLHVELARHAAWTVARRLAQEYPDRMSLKSQRLLKIWESRSEIDIQDGIAALEQIGFAIPEDFAILSQDRCVFVHACCPNGWNPAAIAGRPFSLGGGPETGEKGPSIRFEWTIEEDDLLDHRNLGARRFDGYRFFVRVERQVAFPLPGWDAWILFTRPTFVPDWEIARRPGGREELMEALLALTEEERRAKGLDSDSLCRLMGLVRARRTPAEPLSAGLAGIL